MGEDSFEGWKIGGISFESFLSDILDCLAGCVEFFQIQTDCFYMPILLPGGYPFVQEGTDSQEGCLPECLVMAEQRYPFGVGYSFDFNSITTAAAHIDILACGSHSGSYLTGTPVEKADIVTGFMQFMRCQAVGVGDRFNQWHSQAVGFVDSFVANVGYLAARIFFYAKLQESDFFI